MHSWQMRMAAVMLGSGLAIFAGGLLQSGCSAADTATTRPTTQEAAEQWTTADGLTIVEVSPGAGDAVAKAGDTVSVNYIGKLQSNGQKFDSSYDRGQPIQFPLGAHQVIAGWDEGIAGMKVGEKRQLIIPASLGYGADGTPDGTIPPNATLVFDVELVKIN